jgi:hypothetical protein
MQSKSKSKKQATYESQTVIVREWNTLLNVIDGVAQATENFSQVAAHLHGDDAKMIFLIAPDQEGLGVIVVDTTAGWPVTASVGSLQEAITFRMMKLISSRKFNEQCSDQSTNLP